ncbi:fatty acyl-AMP ligase [Legionella waltersii]|uniref:Saframycin Mx1 synthetase B n=1 Tax=Legionella waltersii TaxID=66969 RepID=A0A0W0ZZT3_9GAMM|nr:fatty acyl-AMP ligase [Legionella waltersii]KTD74622.1 saframycin Mx1 synthetase B [Legionella waltersii]SNV08857.1 saframycin Mx1 synthetase B [Legionella waltersii]
MNSELLQCQTLAEVVQIRAQESPEKITCTFLNRDAEEHMTYKALDRHAKAIASTITEYGAKPGDRILLLFSPGLSLIQAFLGCLYAGCIAVPIYPPAQEKLLDKAQRIIRNAAPVLTLMLSDFMHKFAETNREIPLFLGTRVIPLESVSLAKASLWEKTSASKSDLAFLQYTSGSTMHPKGVMVSHQNLIDNVLKIHHSSQMDDDSILFSWLPPHHDMGLIGCILTPIFAGFSTIMMSPFSFLQNPLSWLKHISRYKVTISGGPNFAYDYCVKRIKEEKKEGLDLSSWKIAFNGAEPIRKETLDHFYSAFKDYGFHKEAFYPCYGLAEATLLVACVNPYQGFTYLTLDKEPFKDHRVNFVEEGAPGSYQLVSCGHQIQSVKIIDPDTLQPCDNDQVGEIWVQSNSVSQGYWEQEKETKQAFHGYINGDNSGPRYLRTGDLGFLHDDQLYVTGRIKDLIIIYGKNHYPQDIEYSLMHADFHKLLGKCSAFVVQEGPEYKLVVMCEVKNKGMGQEEQDKLFNEIFELIYRNHQLEANTIVFVPLKSLPHTTSGKIRRSFCRKHLLENTIPVLASWHLNLEEG